MFLFRHYCLHHRHECLRTRRRWQLQHQPLGRLTILLIGILLCMICNVPTASSSSTPVPVIGILSQPLHDYGHDQNNNSNHTYIAASYVKWLEAGGARSIPIPFYAPTSLVQDILSQVDGVLFPGGGAPVPQSAKDLWKMIHQDYYSQEDYIPIWGTCLGMEFLVQLATNDYDEILSDGYDATNVSLPLLEVQREGLYRSETIYDIVTKHNVTMNNHHLGIDPNIFHETPSLSEKWRVTSTNVDGNGKKFVSTMEPVDKAKNPIYGVQFHPEKNAFEYGLYPNTSIPYEAIDHSLEGISLSLHLARFFVQLAQDNIMMNANGRRRLGAKVHTKGGKYTKSGTYPMVFTYPRKVGYKFEEIYVIPPADHWKIEQFQSTWQARTQLRIRSLPSNSE